MQICSSRWSLYVMLGQQFNISCIVSQHVAVTVHKSYGYLLRRLEDAREVSRAQWLLQVHRLHVLPFI